VTEDTAAVYDYLVIGAGPAGMAASIEASKAGLKVLVLDQEATAGGQIYRNLGQTHPQQENVLGRDYVAGKPLLAEFMACQAEYRPGVQVWHIEAHAKGFLVAALESGKSVTFVTSDLLLANGAMERPMAIAGWQKPGVMTAGAGQILLKTSALLPKQVVLAGSGPLLLLLAQQYRAAGVTILAMLDTTPLVNYWRAIPWMLAGITTPKQLLKGIWLTLVQRFKTPYVSNVSHIEILGKDKVNGVRYTVAGPLTGPKAGRVHELHCDLVMLHQGLIPQLQMARLLGCEQHWHDAKQCWQTRMFEGGKTSVSGVQVAGDNGAIGGADLARLEGRIAGLTRALKNETGASLSTRFEGLWLKSKVKQQHWARGLVDQLYQPAPWVSNPAGDTIVCRCEQVSADQVTAIAKAGCTGVNQLKTFTRAGMGACQGRQCGLNLCHLVAQAQDRPIATVEPLTLRPPLSPITLGQLAQMPSQATDSQTGI